MDYAEQSLKKHYEWQGKVEVVSRVSVQTRDDLSLAYTPGVARPCLEIQKDVQKSFELTRRGNLVAVVTDGTAVLGLGDIGPEAGMPVMEGKCALFKEFGNVDAIPLCVRSKDVDEIVQTIRLISDCKMPIEQALLFTTKNVGDALGFKDQGRVEVGACANACLFTEDFNLTHVVARGRVMMRDGEVVVKGTFEI